jgi:twinkle protein
VPDGSWSTEELRAAASKLKGKMTMYDNFGSTDWTVVAQKIQYMNVAQGIRVFYLDHLTAMADTSDEKGSLEEIMKQMAMLANELNIIIIFVSHLATPEGKPHEEGGRVMVRHFKGSRAIGFWSFYLFGLERDQQAEDEEVRKTTTFRILKDRYTGDATGTTLFLKYDKTTGILHETEKPDEPSMFKPDDNPNF